MIDIKLCDQAPGLLVSVRNAAEARTALSAGADVIDVKEPDRGSLGAADSSVIAAVVQAVAGRAPVSAALGELIDLQTNAFADQHSLPSGVVLFKLGLAGCARVVDWRERWHRVISKYRRRPKETGPDSVAVVYADWQQAEAPPPNDVLQAAADFACPALLIDTWEKSSGSLFDHWSTAELRDFLTRVRARGMKVVLAGSLRGETFSRAVGLSPDLVAVRTAACDSGRTGEVSASRVRSLKHEMAVHLVGNQTAVDEFGAR